MQESILQILFEILLSQHNALSKKGIMFCNYDWQYQSLN